MTRSAVSRSVVKRSRGNPSNAERLVFITVRPAIPARSSDGGVSWRLARIRAVRVSEPSRRNASGASPIGRQRCSSIATRTRSTTSLVSRKWLARAEPNSSIAPVRCSPARAYAVFFIVSVAMTAALSPAVYDAAKSPSTLIAIVRSRTRWGVSPRTTLTRRMADLP